MFQDFILNTWRVLRAMPEVMAMGVTVGGFAVVFRYIVNDGWWRTLDGYTPGFIEPVRTRRRSRPASLLSAVLGMFTAIGYCTLAYTTLSLIVIGLVFVTALYGEPINHGPLLARVAAGAVLYALIKYHSAVERIENAIHGWRAL